MTIVLILISYLSFARHDIVCLGMIFNAAHGLITQNPRNNNDGGNSSSLQLKNNGSPSSLRSMSIYNRSSSFLKNVTRSSVSPSSMRSSNLKTRSSAQTPKSNHKTSLLSGKKRLTPRNQNRTPLSNISSNMNGLPLTGGSSYSSDGELTMFHRSPSLGNSSQSFSPRLSLLSPELTHVKDAGSRQDKSETSSSSTSSSSSSAGWDSSDGESSVDLEKETRRMDDVGSPLPLDSISTHNQDSSSTTKDVLTRRQSINSSSIPSISTQTPRSLSPCNVKESRMSSPLDALSLNRRGSLSTSSSSSVKRSSSKSQTPGTSTGGGGILSPSQTSTAAQMKKTPRSTPSISTPAGPSQTRGGLTRSPIVSPRDQEVNKRSITTPVPSLTTHTPGSAQISPSVSIGSSSSCSSLGGIYHRGPMSSSSRTERFDSSSSTPSAGNGADHFETFLTPREEDEAADRRLRQLTTSSVGTPSQQQINELRTQLVEHQAKLNRMEEQFTKASSRMDAHSVDIGSLQGDLITLQSVVMTNIMSTQKNLRATEQKMQQLVDDHARGYYSKDYLDQLLQGYNQQRMQQEDEMTRLQSQLSMINYQVKEAATSSVQAFDKAAEVQHLANRHHEESSARQESMAIELNTLQNRVNTHEQAICAANTRHVQSMAKQAETAENLAALKEQHKKETEKLDRRTRGLASKCSKTFLSLESSMQSNTQAIAETKANVDNLRTDVEVTNQATNKRLGIVEHRVQTTEENIVATNKRVDEVEAEVDSLRQSLSKLNLTMELAEKIAFATGVAVEASKLKSKGQFSGGAKLVQTPGVKLLTDLCCKMTGEKLECTQIANLIDVNNDVEPEPDLEEKVSEIYTLGHDNNYSLEPTEIGFRILPKLGYAQRSSKYMNNVVKRLRRNSKIPSDRLAAIERDGINIYTRKYKNKKVEEYTANAETRRLELLRVVST